MQPRKELERDQEGRHDFIALGSGNAQVERKNQPRRGEEYGVAGVLGPYAVERGWHPVHGSGVDVDGGTGGSLSKEGMQRHSRWTMTMFASGCFSSLPAVCT